MSHRIEETDSQVLFGEPAWHGLGNVLPEDSPARFDRVMAIKEAGLDWTVGLVPLNVAPAGSYVQGEVSEDVNAEPRILEVGSDIAGATVNGSYGVHRQDTDSIIGVVGDRYRTLQNHEHFKFFDPFLSNGEAYFETAGSLMGGRIIWVLARINREDAVIIPDSKYPDTVRKHLLLCSSHTGIIATSVKFTPTRVVCWNTLSAATSGAGDKLKIKHTQGQKEALSQVQDIINLADERFEATAAQYRKLAQTVIDQEDLVNYVRKVFGHPTMSDQKATGSQLSTRAQNTVNDVVQRAIEGIGQDRSPNTAWAAYNGVTEYITHIHGNNQENRLRNQWFGDGTKINDKALGLALELVKA